MIRFVLTLFLTTLIATPALAQSSDDAVEAETEPRVVYDKRTELDMGELRVDSDIRKPLGAGVAGRRATTFNPLIRLKADFNLEMVESVVQIR